MGPGMLGFTSRFYTYRRIGRRHWVLSRRLTDFARHSPTERVEHTLEIAAQKNLLVFACRSGITENHLLDREGGGAISNKKNG